MTDSPVSPRRPRPVVSLTVLRKEQLSPHLVRIIAGGPGFEAFNASDFTDQYVKILFLDPAVVYPEPIDLAAIRESLPRENWPLTRTYTVRWVDTVAAELAIDFVVHGDEGLAGPWAVAARPGDRILFSGPGGKYRPNPEADWYLFAGDETALPAVSAALEALPADALGQAFLEVGTAEDILKLDAPAGMDINWLLRDGAPAGTSTILADAVAAAWWRDGTVDVFAHGERDAMKSLRTIFFTDHGLQRSQVSLSGYWAFGRTEENFQAEKQTPVGKIL